MRLRKGDVVMCVDAASSLSILEEAEVYEVIDAFVGHVQLHGGALAVPSSLSWLERRFVRVGSVR